MSFIFCLVYYLLFFVFVVATELGLVCRRVLKSVGGRRHITRKDWHENKHPIDMEWALVWLVNNHLGLGP